MNCVFGSARIRVLALTVFRFRAIASFASVWRFRLLRASPLKVVVGG